MKKKIAKATPTTGGSLVEGEGWELAHDLIAEELAVKKRDITAVGAASHYHRQ